MKKLKILYILIAIVSLLFLSTLVLLIVKINAGKESEKMESHTPREVANVTTQEATEAETLVQTLGDAASPSDGDSEDLSKTGDTKDSDITEQPWVAQLEAAKHYDSLVIVSASGSYAEVSFFTKTDDIWKEEFETTGYVGRNGIGKSREGDYKTPTGLYGFSRAFGLGDDPESVIPYTTCDSSYYWVDDSSSRYYNQFVSTDDVDADWNSAEHIADYSSAYRYALAIDYNSDCVPGMGSAIFLHCETGNPTAGCVSIPEDKMVEVLRGIRKNSAIIIDTEDNLLNY